MVRLFHAPASKLLAKQGIVVFRAQILSALPSSGSFKKESFVSCSSQKGPMMLSSWSVNSERRDRGSSRSVWTQEKTSFLRPKTSVRHDHRPWVFRTLSWAFRTGQGVSLFADVEHEKGDRECLRNGSVGRVSSRKLI